MTRRVACDESTKHQNPSTKETSSSKCQKNLNSVLTNVHQTRRSRNTFRGFLLVFDVSLVLGSWRLVLSEV
jgi:hypothetical protein